MRFRTGLACAIACITLLGFFVFPGHTYLQSDTQIYVPMMERLADPHALPSDLVATKPHLSYTIYDEVTLALRRVPGVSFATALETQQLVYRALQILGVYLLATALPLSPPLALAVAAIAGLGATITGPAVLLLEYEPVPRGFAIGLVFLAIGLCARGRWVWASAAASLAFLYHAPTTIPFWLCFLPLLLWRRQWRALLPLAFAALVIAAAAHWQPGVVEKQHFFFYLDPELERLQRLRASYNWVSNWAAALLWQYAALWLLSLAAFWRLRPRHARVFLLGLPVLGLLSVPLSYLLLERLKWGIVSEIQPARVLLFVTAMAIILAAAAGLRAASERRLGEAVPWLFLAAAIPMKNWAVWPAWPQLLAALVFAVVLSVSVAWRKALPAAAVLAGLYFCIPRQYPPLLTDDLRQLIAYADAQTPPDSLWIFADAGRALQPGLFRAQAVRAVYVDWKAGGQVNYYRSLADDWWRRWTDTNQLRYQPESLDRFRSLGIGYMVLSPAIRPPAAEPVFHNTTYAVYRLTPVAKL